MIPLSTRPPFATTLRNAALCALAVLAGSREALAQRAAEVVKQVGFDQKLDEKIPLDLVFKDETGADFRLDAYFGPQKKKPAILLFVYYECPMLCTQVLNGFVRAMKPLGLKPGADFEIVTVSINHRETPELAARKKQNYVELLGRPEAAAGWHFLTGDEASIAKLADAAGFRFMWDPEIEQYAHPGGLVVLTPEGRLSKYFFDVEFSPRDVRFALVEASKEGIGSLTDRFLLLCYHYDPTTGKYGLVINNVIRLLCFLTVAVLGSFMFVMMRRERRLARAAAAP